MHQSNRVQSFNHPVPDSDPMNLRHSLTCCMIASSALLQLTLNLIAHLALELPDLLLERRDLLHELPLAPHIAAGFVERLTHLSRRVKLSL